MSDSPLQGRIFDRSRRFEQLSAELREQVAALRLHLLLPETQAQALEPKKDKDGLTVEGSKLLAAVSKYLSESKAADASMDAAKRLADGLVLSGFVSPRKETFALQGFDFDGELFTLVDPSFSSADSQSVWAFKEGAIQAGELKRKKTGMMAKFTGGTSSVYVVANDKKKTVAVFDSDVARHPTMVLDVSSGSVEFDAAIPHGVRLTGSKGSEVFGTPSKEKQDEWLNSFINAGATYREAFNLGAQDVKSF
ncbi:hypothetical protein ATCC90586_001518 [Pythium insidiosum]|nr:hypothetical protein ATCC90586_001518 [Pythium insidiosum]